MLGLLAPGQALGPQALAQVVAAGEHQAQAGVDGVEGGEQGDQAAEIRLVAQQSLFQGVEHQHHGAAPAGVVEGAGEAVRHLQGEALQLLRRQAAAHLLGASGLAHLVDQLAQGAAGDLQVELLGQGAEEAPRRLGGALGIDEVEVKAGAGDALGYQAPCQQPAQGHGLASAAGGVELEDPRTVAGQQLFEGRLQARALQVARGLVVLLGPEAAGGEELAAVVGALAQGRVEPLAAGVEHGHQVLAAGQVEGLVRLTVEAIEELCGG